jgi:hypothetical protein
MIGTSPFVIYNKKIHKPTKKKFENRLNINDIYDDKFVFHQETSEERLLNQNITNSNEQFRFHIKPIKTESSNLLSIEKEIISFPKEIIPSSTETVSSPKENVPSSTETVSSPKENVPSSTETVSSPKENVPSSTETVSSPKENVPSSTETVSSPKKTVSLSKETDTSPSIQTNTTEPTIQYKYRLDKYEDSETGEIKFRLNKVAIDVPTKNNILEKSEKTSTNDIPIVNNQKKYVLDKIVTEEGNTRYCLKEMNQSEKTIELNDESDNTEFNSTDNQQFIISKKYIIKDINKNSNILLGTNKNIEKTIHQKEILENSIYLNNTNQLNYINIRLISNNNTSIECALNLFHLGINDNVLKKIGKFELGEIKNNSGKIYTKILDYKTPTHGCFLISILDVKSTDILIDSIHLDFDLYITKRKTIKEKNIDLSLNKNIYVQ